jgi:hypothetical protein
MVPNTTRRADRRLKRWARNERQHLIVYPSSDKGGFARRPLRNLAANSSIDKGGFARRPLRGLAANAPIG